MISVLQSARLCVEIYESKPEAWTHYYARPGLVVGHRVLEGYDTFTFMGTANLPGMIRDAMAAVAIWDEDIGMAAAGFVEGLYDFLVWAKPLVTLPIWLQGHSLGGAQARNCAGKMLVAKWNVVGLHVFGSPRPAFANLGRIFDKAGLVRTSWRNRNDPIPEVPPPFPIPFRHTEDWGVMDEHAAPDDLTPFRDHHGPLYLAGAAKVVWPAAPSAPASLVQTV